MKFCCIWRKKCTLHCTEKLENLSSLVISAHEKRALKTQKKWEEKKYGWLNTSREKLKIYSLPTVTPLRDLRCLSFLHLYKRCSPTPRSQLLRHWVSRWTWCISSSGPPASRESYILNKYGLPFFLSLSFPLLLSIQFSLEILGRMEAACKLLQCSLPFIPSPWAQLAGCADV